MQYSVVKSSKIDLGDRVDAEYFEPSYLENESKLKRVNAEPLSKYVKLTSSAFYPSATGYYEVGEIPFIRCVDCIDYPAITTLQKDRFERLPHDFINENKTIKKIKDGDIVITKVGSPCFASIIYGLGEVALSRTVLGAYKIKGIDPFYLIVFLRSKYGFEQLIRERELTIQYQLTLERVGRILTYEPTGDFQRIIRQLFIKSQDLYINEVEQYQKAEQLLLSELGLTDWKPKHTLAFVKNFSDTQKAERIDAEYFQPKYEEIIEAIKRYKGGFDELGNLTKLIGHPSNPPYETINTENKTFIITQKHLSNYFPVDNFWKDEEALYTTDDFIEKNKKYILQDNDIILYSVGAYIGKANLYNANIKATIGSFLTLIRPKIEKINPFYLLVFLNSKIGQELTRRNSRGLAQQYIYPYDTRQVIVPILEISKQKEIEKLILNGQKSHNLSKSLLEIAKRGVEIAIEQDEQEAQKWITGQLEALGVELKEDDLSG